MDYIANLKPRSIVLTLILIARVRLEYLCDSWHLLRVVFVPAEYIYYLEIRARGTGGNRFKRKVKTTDPVSAVKKVVKAAQYMIIKSLGPGHTLTDCEIYGIDGDGDEIVSVPVGNRHTTT